MAAQVAIKSDDWPSDLIDYTTSLSIIHRCPEQRLACWTQEEIAEEVGVPQPTINAVVSESAELPDSIKPAALHQIDFEIPLYNVKRQRWWS
ncbi:hypothetical protein [Alloacidobacterium sp.]|uniref:hypothetical protein n=1 Tax=Alloacidobacterium sp. TaxID=2951999 RepID=UPI002D678CCC|nr:hypothetical protein [Alloacidobacterium sp.]HYK37480.1 hypothetical protein [Alloacidobacterium sp.]